MRRDKSNGFTLVEMLVVVAIIGILAALLFTSISQAKRKARQIQCFNNLRQLGVALQGFVQTYEVYPLNQNNDYPTSGHMDHSRTWSEALNREGFGKPNDGNVWFTNGVWTCPAARWNRNEPGANTMGMWFSYGYNWRGLNSPGKNGALGLGGREVSPSNAAVLSSPVGESEIVVPSEMMAIGDSFYGNPDLQRATWTSAKRMAFTVVRHKGNANVSFCDGHIESPTLNFMFEDITDEALIRWNRDHLPHREQLSP